MLSAVMVLLCDTSVSAMYVLTAGLAEEALLLRWPEVALQAGDEEGALEGAGAACQAVPTSSAAWQQRLALQARLATLQVSTQFSSCSYRVQYIAALGDMLTVSGCAAGFELAGFSAIKQSAKTAVLHCLVTSSL